MRFPNKFTEFSGPNDSYVWASTFVFWMSLSLLHIIRRRGTGVCPSLCTLVSGGVSDTAVWALWDFIRIQHTACKMQQMGSSLEWQLRVCCHPELQLACQSKAAPRSFLHIRMFHLSASLFTPFSSFKAFLSYHIFFIWPPYLPGVCFFGALSFLSSLIPHMPNSAKLSVMC